MIGSEKEFWVKCKPCGHVWIAAYLPMEMFKFAEVAKGAHCPCCGADAKQLTCATAGDVQRAREP
jgi:rubredoxin